MQTHRELMPDDSPAVKRVSHDRDVSWKTLLLSGFMCCEAAIRKCCMRFLPPAFIYHFPVFGFAICLSISAIFLSSSFSMRSSSSEKESFTFSICSFK